MPKPVDIMAAKRQSYTRYSTEWDDHGVQEEPPPQTSTVARRNRLSPRTFRGTARKPSALTPPACGKDELGEACAVPDISFAAVSESIAASCQVLRDADPHAKVGHRCKLEMFKGILDVERGPVSRYDCIHPPKILRFLLYSTFAYVLRYRTFAPRSSRRFRPKNAGHLRPHEPSASAKDHNSGTTHRREDM